MNLPMVIALIKKYNSKARDNIILKSPDGTEFVITISDDGTINSKGIHYLSDISKNNIITKDGNKIIFR